jgi:FkbM family methyltransferase
MFDVRALPSRPPDRARWGAGTLRTQGVSQEALRDEVEEYFLAGADVRRGGVVLDVGANVGAFALAAAERVEGELTLHCFEAAVPTFEVLASNFRDNAVLRRTRHTLNLVALTRPEDAGPARSFYFFRRLPTDSTYDIAGKRLEFQAFFHGHAVRIERGLGRFVPVAGRPAGKLARAVIEHLSSPKSRTGVWLTDTLSGLEVRPCPTAALGDWLRERRVPRVDLVKIDVEGAEGHVLEGLEGAWSDVEQLAVETHERGGRCREIVERIRGEGFRSIDVFRPRIAASTGLDNVLIFARRRAAAEPR